MVIRDFEPRDVEAIVAILKANQQYGHEEIDGPEAMLRVHQCQAAEFLVAEEDGHVVGMARGVYDGSRALLHIISIDPKRQRQGTGKVLLCEIAKRFKARGATDMAVTVPGEVGFWQRYGFRVTTRIMLIHPIEKVCDL
ncbi:MAG: GNAT family N-acetyltransferase [Chloroflexi bacterium]|nr:GNAT family N-acetyltransferase [Chloroflexota bacterium]MBU1749701.1 GNAT family N-acetyltransferase [Chloroflexota bacterium]